MLVPEIRRCVPNAVQLVRYDDMFECGKGIIVLWEGRGGSYIPATGKNSGLEFLLKCAREENSKAPEYKLKQAWFKLMLGRNYDEGIIVVK